MSLISQFPSSLTYAIVAVVVVCLLPYVCAAAAKMSGGFNAKTDNADPRTFLANTKGMSARFNYAQLNSFESLPIFIAAVFMAMYCFVPQHIINAVAWLYVALRVIYIAAYALNMSAFRSVAWLLSLSCCLLLFYFSYILIR